MKKKKQQLRCAAATLLAFSFTMSSCCGFSYSKRKQQLLSGGTSSLQYTNIADNSSGDTAIATQQQPHWIPMEIAELAADDLEMPHSEFVRTFSDIEAYTSCDDDEDSLHECDHFGQYLTPTKWLHLTPSAHESAVNRLHFQIWKDVWQNPHGSVEVADAVSKETLRYYNEFMLEEPRPSVECHTRRPLVRVKVVPASFGLEGFEDAIWEATEDLLTQSDEEEMNHADSTAAATTSTNTKRAVTFVVASPDILDPSLGKESPQAEFEPDRFRSFASTLMEKLTVFSDIEDVPLMDEIELTSFHPLWKNSCSIGSSGIVEIDGSSRGGCHFPYPAVAVSMVVKV